MSMYQKESESDLFTGTIHGNTDCYLQFCAPRLPQGAVSGRVSAAARVRPACAGLSLGRLALVTPTCLLVSTSSLSIYRYPKSFTHYSRRPHAPPPPGRHPVVSSYLAGAAFDHQAGRRRWRRRLAAFDLPRTFASGRGVVEAAIAKRRRATHSNLKNPPTPLQHSCELAELEVVEGPRDLLPLSPST